MVPPLLEEKRAVKHREDGPRYIFMPRESREKASRSALKRVVQTFFDRSLADAVTALVEAKLDPAELVCIEKIIRQAKTK